MPPFSPQLASTESMTFICVGFSMVLHVLHGWSRTAIYWLNYRKHIFKSVQFYLVLYKFYVCVWTCVNRKSSSIKCIVPNSSYCRPCLMLVQWFEPILSKNIYLFILVYLGRWIIKIFLVARAEEEDNSKMELRPQSSTSILSDVFQQT